MLDGTTLFELGRAFNKGFLFDSTSETLDKYLKNHYITDSDRKILKNALDFLSFVEEGAKLKQSGKLGSYALESASAYRTSISVFFSIKKQNDRDFQRFLENVKKAIQNLNKSGEGDDEDIQLAKEFFSQLSTKSLQSLTEDVYKLQRGDKWTKV